MISLVRTTAAALAVASVATAGRLQRRQHGNFESATQSQTSPAYDLFTYPVPFPEIATPVTSITTNNVTIDYYEVTIQPFEKQVFPNLGTASMVGYNAMTPGPTYWIERGRQTVIRYHNNQTQTSVVHLHGSNTHSPWDGWAGDFIEPGQYKDMYYPNDNVARNLWYHDHTDHLTTSNSNAGLCGMYIIYDDAELEYGLPSGKYDVQLSIQDRTYDSNGGLVTVDPSVVNNLFGDVIEVNGQPWPFMQVEPRKYRIRFWDMSISRPYDLYFEQPNGDWLEFQVVGSDSGLLGYPVSSNDLEIAMGERYEVVIDFAANGGQNVTLKNGFSAEGNDVVNYENTDKVMLFIVGDSVSDTTNNGDVPSTLNSAIAFPEAKTEVDQTFRFQLGGDDHWTINGIGFDDVNNRMIARPEYGSTQLWEVVYAGGPGVHPVHLHLVDLQIISRTGGSRGVLPYEAAGLKDIALLEPGETVRLLAHFGPWNGIYMFHCHNLVHEDNNMMVDFNITILEDMGYNPTTDFVDPLDARFVAKAVQDDTYDDASISGTLSYLAGLNAYATQYVLAAESIASTQTTVYAASTVSSDAIVTESTQPLITSSADAASLSGATSTLTSIYVTSTVVATSTTSETVDHAAPTAYGVQRGGGGTFWGSGAAGGHGNAGGHWWRV